MAGNVIEWCRNPKAPGYAARGGGWDDRVYAFGQTAGYPASYSSATLGFRCVKETGDGDQGEFALSPSGFLPVYKPVDDRQFAEIRARYDYARSPLDARVVQTVDAPDWRRETIHYNVAGNTVIAYLYLPKGFRGPLQVIHFAPAGDVERGMRSLSASIEGNLPPIIRGGRAVFSVALEGYLDRPRKGQIEPDTRSEEYVDYAVARATELRRGLDYLETRPEIDASRTAFLGPSAGSNIGVIITAVEKRYRSVMFVGAGITAKEVADAAAANRINFAPHISAPKLLLQGRYDEDTPMTIATEPLLRLLREPKRLIVYEGGHTPSRDVWVREIQKWLDETLGKVGA
jgi:dienelactone hydrolase